MNFQSLTANCHLEIEFRVKLKDLCQKYDSPCTIPVVMLPLQGWPHSTHVKHPEVKIWRILIKITVWRGRFVHRDESYATKYDDAWLTFLLQPRNGHYGDLMCFWPSANQLRALPAGQKALNRATKWTGGIYILVLEYKPNKRWPARTLVQLVNLFSRAVHQ